MESPRVKKAKKFLASAKVLLEHGDYDSCISRCYYAVFHAAIALLEKLGIRQKKWEHKFVLAAFSLELVHKRKIMPSESREVFRFLFDQRNEADYDVEEKTLKKAKRAFDKAETLFYSILEKANYEKPQKA